MYLPKELIDIEPSIPFSEVKCPTTTDRFELHRFEEELIHPIPIINQLPYSNTVQNLRDDLLRRVSMQLKKLDSEGIPYFLESANPQVQNDLGPSVFLRMKYFVPEEQIYRAIFTIQPFDEALEDAGYYAKNQVRKRIERTISRLSARRFI